MDEFIKREDALNAIKAISSVCGCSAIDRDDAENAIMDCPTSDVAPKGEVHDDHHKQVTCYALGCQEGDKIKREVAREILTDLAYNKNLLPLPSWAIEKLIKEYTEGRMNMAEESNDIFAGYENDLQKAVALIEWQKTEIESLTINLNAIGLAAKRLAEERQEVVKTLSDIKRQIHEKAIYPHNAGIKPHISVREVDAIIEKEISHVKGGG